MFQGEWIPNTGRALLRLLVDNVVVSGPGDAASPFAATEASRPRPCPEARSSNASR